MAPGAGTWLATRAPGDRGDTKLTPPSRQPAAASRSFAAESGRAKSFGTMHPLCGCAIATPRPPAKTRTAGATSTQSSFIEPTLARPARGRTSLEAGPSLDVCEDGISADSSRRRGDVRTLRSSRTRFADRVCERSCPLERGDHDGQGDEPDVVDAHTSASGTHRHLLSGVVDRSAVVSTDRS